jgi:alcohol dehydrogenase class IV
VGREFESVIPLMMAKLKFGIGAMEELGYELKVLGAEKVLLVADKHLWDVGLVDKAKDLIRDEGIYLSIYDEIHIEPTDVSMRQAISVAQDVEPDAFVALGGGSTLDTAKAMNLFSTYPADLYDRQRQGGPRSPQATDRHAHDRRDRQRDDGGHCPRLVGPAPEDRHLPQLHSALDGHR